MSAYSQISKDKYFKKYKKEVPMFKSFCTKHGYKLSKLADWYFEPLKVSYLVATMYSGIENQYIEKQIKLFTPKEMV